MFPQQHHQMLESVFGLLICVRDADCLAEANGLWSGGNRKDTRIFLGGFSVFGDNPVSVQDGRFPDPSRPGLLQCRSLPAFLA